MKLIFKKDRDDEESVIGAIQSQFERFKWVEPREYRLTCDLEIIIKKKVNP